MSPRSASREGAARLAVVGAPSTEGARIREALARRGVPGTRVDLYGISTGEVLLSEYDGEARLIQEPDLQEIAEHDVVFLCEEGDVAAGIAEAAPDALIIDVLRCLPAQPRVPRVHLDINPEVLGAKGHGAYAVPHYIALLLAELLAPLDREVGIREVAAIVLRPASDFGEPGVEELREQTVRLLNFAEVPVATFGRQLAFNLIPQTCFGRKQAMDIGMAEDIADLLGWESTRLALRLITAPIFYGHALQLRFRIERSAGLDEIGSILRDAGFPDPRSELARATPLDVTGEADTSLADLSEDGVGGYWLWVVAGDAAAKSAEQAVRLADRLGDL